MVVALWAQLLVVADMRTGKHVTTWHVLSRILARFPIDLDPPPFVAIFPQIFEFAPSFLLGACVCVLV